MGIWVLVALLMSVGPARSEGVEGGVERPFPQPGPAMIRR